MNRKLPASVLVVAIAASSFGVIAYAQGVGGTEGGDAGAGAEKPAPRPRPRWQQSPKLPEQYRARDKDKDGQIGLYEWDRRDYATFRKLDLNHDGFLTADELTRKPPSRSPASVAAAPARPAAPASSGTGTASESSPAAGTDTAATSSTEKPAAAAGDAPAAATASNPSGAGRSDTERQWELLDKDGDGKLTEAEWGKSILTKMKFAKAGIAVSFPMTQEEFVRLYSQLPGAGN
jgi:hypothetical protein